MFKFKNRFLGLFYILLIGGLGGILADQFLLPYLSTVSPFSKIKFIRQAGDGTTIINPTERIVITENTGIEEAIDKINPSLVSILGYQGNRIVSQGTGFVITSDGLVLTASNLTPSIADKYLVFRNSHSSVGEIIKKDSETGLALIKIEENNLPVVALVELENLRLGQRIILVGSQLIEDELNRFVNLGIIRSIEGGTIKVNLKEENSWANGGPLINIAGEVIGLNLIDQSGLIKTVPVSKIKSFLDF